MISGSRRGRSGRFLSLGMPNLTAPSSTGQPQQANLNAPILTGQGSLVMIVEEFCQLFAQTFVLFAVVAEHYRMFEQLML
jgi:hypothetical protein